jgi:hypothetical protein
MTVNEFPKKVHGIILWKLWISIYFFQNGWERILSMFFFLAMKMTIKHLLCFASTCIHTVNNHIKLLFTFRDDAHSFTTTRTRSFYNFCEEMPLYQTEMWDK